MKPVPINFVADVLDFDLMERDELGSMFRKDLPPGSAHWEGNDEPDRLFTLNMTCPCGCGRVHCIPVHKGEKLPGHWLWDGNREKPTLTPSILATVGCRWHGYLTNGEFVSC